MATTYKFQSDHIPICGNSEGMYFQIEMQTVTIFPYAYSWGADTTSTTGGLAAIDWNAGVIDMDWCFNSPSIERGSAPQAGVFANNNMSFECDNYELTTSGHTISQILYNAYPDLDVTYLRFSHKNSLTAGWTYKFVGIVDSKSIQRKMPNLNDSTTWEFKFDVNDITNILSERKVAWFVEDKLKHALTDLSASNMYATFVGTSSNGKGAGKYLIDSFKNYSDQYVSGMYAGASIYRYFNIVEIFNRVSQYIGCEAPLNDGASWSSLYSWKFGYHDGSTIQFVDIDKLYIISGAYALFSGLIYNNRYSYFDIDNICPVSFYGKESVLEMLKSLCVSLGLIFSIEINSLGKQYLFIREAGYFDSASGTVYSLFGSEDMFIGESMLKPNDKNIRGISVISPVGNDITRGSVGTDNIKIDTIFNSAAWIREDAGTVFNPSNIYIERWRDMFTCLWISPDTPSGTWTGNAGSTKSLTNIYSCCTIIPRLNSQAADDLSIHDFVSASGATYGVVGYYQNTLSVTGITYPNPAFTQSFSEMPAMALCHYYYSPFQKNNDVLGIYRKSNSSLSVKISGFTSYQVGQKLIFNIDNNPQIWFITNIKEDFDSYVTELELENRE